ncbi:glycosyltransferase family A protein [Nostoc sp. FACHB-110]|uniref:glycosyltransferase family 2 protein n=1 Tax=Nostoc sp. FACHB-110 TaxID=2692834 RepID=UPI00168A3C4D|nr:glycosyltransferase family A protein [Nostoc sp. FACHB-110]MBD2440127.1 glycosyltransferase family 2 protein [Nostoc sp. FACHB-110]
MTKAPLVSVIVPAYNAARFIDRTLNSILSQTYKNTEVIVVDDGSEDRTSEIVELFAQQDSRVILLQQENAGVAAARNLAIQKSRGEYIAPIDADDIWYPQKLEKQVECLVSADESVGLVYAWSVGIDEDDVIISDCDYEYYAIWRSLEGKVYPALIYSNFLGNASVPLIRRICFERIGDYNCKLRARNAQGCEDWDLYLRIAECYKFRVVKDFLVGYRQLTGSMSCNYHSMAFSYYLIIRECQKRHLEIPKYIFDLSESEFKLYLAFKSGACADNWHTLILFYQAINLDYCLLLQSWIYKSLLIFILKALTQPLTALIWNNYVDWMQFRRKMQLINNQNISSKTVKLENKITHNYSIDNKKIAEKIKLKRWLKVLDVCNKFELSLKKKDNLVICKPLIK